MATHDKGKTKRGKNAPHFKKENKLSIDQNGKNDTCFFYKKKGHMNKDCQKYLRWLKKKGNIISLVCHELFFVEAPSNTWWIHSGSTIHIVTQCRVFLTQGNQQAMNNGSTQEINCIHMWRQLGLSY
jgi:hypothetical protein